MSSRNSTERHVVESELTDARIARQWAGTQERIAAKGRARWRLPALAAPLAAVLVFLAYSFARAPGAVHVSEGALFEGDDSRTISLNDGSRVDLAPHSRLRVNVLESQRVELDLEQGGAWFDVRHLASRRFVVHVDRFDVIDVGTRFRVDRAGAGAVTVFVERGAVSVERRDASDPARFVGAGERWSASAIDHAEIGPPDAGDTAVISPPPPASKAASAETTAEPEPQSPASVGARSPAARPASSKDLLDAAQRAQREGHIRDAAATYDRLRRSYRADARAGLAAFELGRLRLDPLGDPRGAAEAFRDAIALSPNAPFREDAAAHLVEALDAAGDAAGCTAARSAYLASYPRGLHRASVSARCERNR